MSERLSDSEHGDEWKAFFKNWLNQKQKVLEIAQ